MATESTGLKLLSLSRVNMAMRTQERPMKEVAASPQAACSSRPDPGSCGQVSDVAAAYCIDRTSGIGAPIRRGITVTRILEAGGINLDIDIDRKDEFGE